MTSYFFRISPDITGVSMENIHVIVQDDDGQYHRILPLIAPDTLDPDIVTTKMATGFVSEISPLANEKMVI